MKTTFAFATIAAALAAGLANAGVSQVITQWNFNASSTDPSVGAGFAGLVGGVTSPGFNSGAGSSDPTQPGLGWQTTTYAAQGQESGLRGVQFNVSTVGFESILVSWDQRHSNTSSRWVQFQYSLDGVNFVDGDLFEATSGDTWFNGRTVDLASIAGAGNNADFAFRIVSVFGPAGGYQASNPTSNYAAGGTWRFDMVTVSGVIPTPGALALLGVTGIIGFRRRRA